MPKKKPAKHPHEMTTDEAVKHLFHPEVVKHLKRHAVKASPKPKRKKAD